MNRLRRLLALCGCLALSSQTLAAELPQRIVSLNLCTDQLLLVLVKRQRIAMLSQLAGDVLLSWQASQADGITRFDGSTEKVLSLAPDLVLTGAQVLTGPTGVLKRLGVRIETLTMPESVAASLDFIDTVAALVGADGRQLRAQTVARLEAVRRARPASASPLAVIYLPNGLSPGAQTLKHELLVMAGFRNLSAELGISDYGSISLETLIQYAPALILLDAVDLEHASLGQQLLHHPALRISGAIHSRVVPTPTWICGGPQIAEAAEALGQFRAQLDTGTIAQ